MANMHGGASIFYKVLGREADIREMNYHYSKGRIYDTDSGFEGVW